MSKKLTTEEFIKRANEIHGDKYDYSKSEYIDAKTNVCIICHEHGEFWQTPSKHLSGQGCPKCAEISRMNNRKHIDDKKFIDDAIKVHGDKYDYSLVKNCSNNHTNVKIICKEHGVFEQDYAHHVGRKQGCPKCAGNFKLNNFIFEEKSNIIHNDKYIYENVDYISTHKKVIITCPIHGNFEQTPHDHLEGKGCPKCANKISKCEEEIYSFILEKLNNEEIIKRDRSILTGKELDIYIPSLNIGIEYNGVIWHSEKFGTNKYYHLNKLEECNTKGIKLIQVFEDEYINHKDIVNSKILRALGVYDGLEKISARACLVKEIDNELSKDFLEKNHIQGFVNSTKYLGCFFNSKLIGVMTFTEESDGYWNLTRFATDNKYICRGVGGKLFSYFVKNFKPIEVKSFADRRWTLDKDNNLYTKLGFKLDKILEPDYRYVNGKERIHKFNFRKNALHKKYGFPLSMTELEMANNLGYYRIWDCGLFKYIWKNDDN